MDNPLHFRKVERKDKTIIRAWLSEPHVKVFFYGAGLKNTLHNLDLYCEGKKDNGQYRFDHWMAFYHERPFGFIMTSPVSGPYDPNDDYDKWYLEGRQTFTMDVLIGDKAFLGKGLACPMIRKFILTQFPAADFFIIDPEIVNTKAIHVYEKVGFKKVGELSPDFNPKPHVMMRLDVRVLTG